VGAPLKGGTSRAAQQAKPTHLPAFHAHPQSFVSAAPARTARDQVHSFLRSVRDGVLAPLKTEPARAHLAPASFRLPPKPARLPVGRAGLLGGGAALRGGRRPGVLPPFPSHPAHVGLGAARTFSAGAQPFANVASNVPLALRALGGEGLDERKWRQVRRRVRHQLRTDVKGKGRELSHAERQQMRQAEFAAFFGTKAEEAASAAINSAESVAEADGICAPVVLVLPLEPALTVSAEAADTFDGPPSSYRLLSSNVLSSLDAIQNAYTIHADRVRALSSRLTRAGAFDDPATAVELVFVSDGRKEVHLAFGPRWTHRDVVQAAGGWRGEEATFWEIVGGEASSPSIPSVRSDVFGDEMDEHDQVKSTLVLPNHSLDFDATRYSSPSLSPTASSFASVEENEFGFFDFSLTQEAQVWTDFSCPAAGPFPPTFVSIDAELAGDDDHWSVAFEDEGSDASGEPATEAWSERSYESGVRDFLTEVEQELDGQRMFARM